MKVIKVTETDGVVHYINPKYVKEVKVTKSDYNADWCIAVFLMSNGNYSDLTTILCKTEQEKDEKLNEILNLIENTL